MAANWGGIQDIDQLAQVRVYLRDKYKLPAAELDCLSPKDLEDLYRYSLEEAEED